MARRTIDIAIEAEGRDKGRVYRITEMPASVGEQWALDAINGVARSGLVHVSDLKDTPMAGLAALGVQAFMGMAKADLQPLLAQMFSCVTRVMPAAPQGRLLQEEDIEEVTTRLKLRREIFELHTGFFANAESFNLTAAQAATGANTPNT